MVRRRRRSLRLSNWRSKRRRSRSGDGGAVIAGEDNGAGGLVKGSCDGGV
jgi:hypothetical protein